MIKTVLSLSEIGLIETCLDIVYNSMNYQDLQDILGDNEKIEELQEYYSQGYFEDLLKWCESFDN